MQTNFKVRTSKQECSYGSSLITLDPIEAGQLIWHMTTKINDTRQLSIDEISKLDVPMQDHFIKYSWQDSDTQFTGCVGDPNTDMTNYINHSCEPNMWFDGDDRLVAIRDISVGESLTIDYSTCDSTYCMIESCMCGSKLCRKIISPTDYLVVNYQNHMRSYLLRKLNK